VNAEEELLTCTSPFLYLRATKDRLVTEKSVRLIRNLHPGTVAVEIESSLFVHQSKPGECWDPIEKLVGRVT
jgi:pimeloyl-ACP methyl ester carboxylesterase